MLHRVSGGSPCRCGANPAWVAIQAWARWVDNLDSLEWRWVTLRRDSPKISGVPNLLEILQTTTSTTSSSIHTAASVLSEFQ